MTALTSLVLTRTGTARQDVAPCLLAHCVACPRRFAFLGQYSPACSATGSFAFHLRSSSSSSPCPKVYAYLVSQLRLPPRTEVLRAALPPLPLPEPVPLAVARAAAGYDESDGADSSEDDPTSGLSSSGDDDDQPTSGIDDGRNQGGGDGSHAADRDAGSDSGADDFTQEPRAAVLRRRFSFGHRQVSRTDWAYAARLGGSGSSGDEANATAAGAAAARGGNDDTLGMNGGGGGGGRAKMRRAMAEAAAAESAALAAAGELVMMSPWRRPLKEPFLAQGRAAQLFVLAACGEEWRVSSTPYPHPARSVGTFPPVFFVSPPSRHPHVSRRTSIAPFSPVSLSFHPPVAHPPASSPLTQLPVPVHP